MKQLQRTQKELHATLRNTTALTASNGSLKATLDATHQLAQTMNSQVSATAPVMREAMGSVAADVHAVGESTEAVEKETLSLIRETRPLVEQTIKDTDALTRSSKQVIDLLHNLLGPWLEPADGRQPEPLKIDVDQKLRSRRECPWGTRPFSPGGCGCPDEVLLVGRGGRWSH